MQVFETILKVLLGALLAFIAERVVHIMQERARRRSAWDHLRSLGKNVSFAISRPLMPDNAVTSRDCDDYIMKRLCKKCGWEDDTHLPVELKVRSLEDLSAHLCIIGSPKYNAYATLIQKEFATGVEFVWDMYAGEPVSSLQKLVTRHGEEYVSTRDLKTENNKYSVDYGILFHTVLRNGKQIFWIAGIHGPATVGVWKALTDQPELFADMPKTKLGEGHTWLFRVTHAGTNDWGQRGCENHITDVDFLGMVSAQQRSQLQYPLRAIIFDLGNVLMLFDRTRTYRSIAHWLGRDWRDIERAVESTPLRGKYERGELTTVEFRKQICRTLKIEDSRLPDNLFEEFWGDIFFANSKMITTLKKLHSMNNHALVLCSNTNELHFQSVAAHFPEVINSFDKRLALSFEQHCDKSSDNLFRYALQIAGSDISPQECLFIDDNPDNIKRAKKIGMKGLVYFKYPQLIIRMREWGIYLS